jgi:hypothetical protein
MLGIRSAPGWHDRRAQTEDDVLAHLHDAVRDQTATDPAMTVVPTAPKALLEEILASLDDDKAEEIVTIDLKGKSEMADLHGDLLGPFVASGRRRLPKSWWTGSRKNMGLVLPRSKARMSATGC